MKASTEMCEIIFFSTSLILLLALNVQCLPPTIIRQTTNGPVEGIEQTSALGQKYYAFRGIPFAEPPITGRDPYTGRYVDRRFKPPVPLKRRWTEPLKAHNDGKSCYQIQTMAGISPTPANVSEDCLFLNTYVPATGSKWKTVLVYIYGGAFFMGDATDKAYGPDFLLSRDNIVVKMQYRVGIYGFLNLNDGTYTGNMGLKDQQLALKWIYENIENFGGKKEEILLFGLSAGGASVHYHMVNEISRTLFNRTLMMSTTGFSSYAMREASHLPEVQQCTQIYDMNKLIAYLKTANSSAFDTCYPWKIPGELDPIWVPTIESPNAKDAFLTKTLDEIYSSDDAPHMDAMFSFTPQEIITFLPDLTLSTEPLIKENGQVKNFTFPFEGFTERAYPEEYAKAVEKLWLAYFVNATSIDAIKSANIALKSDAVVTDGILKAVVLQTNANNKKPDKTGAKKTFLYRFDVNSDLNLNMMNPIFKNNPALIGHGDDMCYGFKCNCFDSTLHYAMHLEQKDKNYYIIQRLMEIITNFARTGDPSIEGDTPFRSCKSSDEIFCQEFPNEPPTYTTFDIKNQLHYDVWREIEEIASNQFTVEIHQ